MKNNIFISIASYRDTELIPTLDSLLNMSSQTSRLHVVVCWQDEGNLSEFEQAGILLRADGMVGEFPVFRASIQGTTIDVISVHYTQSRGAGFARHLCETRYDNEAYFLQIDSHCRFVSGWDDKMIAMLENLRVQSVRPVLSTYPPDYQPGPPEIRSEFLSRLVFKAFTQEGFSMQTSVPVRAERPLRNCYLAGGFIFADGHFVKNVPSDPNIFFYGEEISMAVRAFTHGYDAYTPHTFLLWHCYGRRDKPKVWYDHNNQAKEKGEVRRAWWEWDQASKSRVAALLTSGVTSDTKWLGSMRTLQDFCYASGLCFLTRRVHPDVISKKCSYFDVQDVDYDNWQTNLITP
ncbi:GlcNAc-transferase family protein [Scandinavium sp. V105_16]|uniref:GlcNAc-transferase family protein n=1 Tax=Scandinavium lactucae TaxID=3095028 RepID=A0AAJ2VVA8_9ENTR|nr:MULTISPECIES: GlcNAc-transferase family protein [unclassified Scandinavium]MDX6019760.1 GlcNAc-transferase family protein [Scandinavium sp. V105_16]MDX6032863.1 GlcNAc-transferase family protein [Scandinavium sp. V105_12]